MDNRIKKIQMVEVLVELLKDELNIYKNELEQELEQKEKNMKENPKSWKAYKEPRKSDLKRAMLMVRKESIKLDKIL